MDLLNWIHLTGDIILSVMAILAMINVLLIGCETSWELIVISLDKWIALCARLRHNFQGKTGLRKN